MSTSIGISRPRLLDAFCGAGGATKGYQRAGFHVTGVDLKAQPDYVGDEFHQGDAVQAILEHGHEFDFIHASPPCQAHVQWRGINLKKWGSVPDHLDLIPPTRSALREVGRPYVIENVVGAPMEIAVMLCGSMFGLGVRRHRLFESSELIWGPPPCAHTRREVAVYGKLDGRRIWTRTDGTEVRAARTIEQARAAMGIDWMQWDELKESIPPAYTFWLGSQLLASLSSSSSTEAP